MLDQAIVPQVLDIFLVVFLVTAGFGVALALLTMGLEMMAPTLQDVVTSTAVVGVGDHSTLHPPFLSASFACRYCGTDYEGKTCPKCGGPRK